MIDTTGTVEVEEGVMIVKDGKGWGVAYKDGQYTCEGWVEPIRAGIHDPRYLAKPTDATYAKSPDIKELKKGHLVKVKRINSVQFLE